MNRIKKVRLIDGRVALIETTKEASPWIQGSIEKAGGSGSFGPWGTLSKSKIEKDNNGYKGA